MPVSLGAAFLHGLFVGGGEVLEGRDEGHVVRRPLGKLDLPLEVVETLLLQPTQHFHLHLEGLALHKPLSQRRGHEIFGEEYEMNGLLGRLGRKASSVKQVSLWDGVVMGGGAGISAHGRFRVATEKALFAMPETGIGLFPDVGASYYLRRMPSFTGTYAGLTGARLDAADLLYAGLATHFVTSDKLDTLVEALATVDDDSKGEDPLAFDAAVEAVVDDFASRPDTPSKLETFADDIERAFAKPTVEAIVEELEDLVSEMTSSEQSETTTSSETQSSSSRGPLFAPFASEALAALRKASPTSLKVTLAAIRDGHDLDLDATLKNDFRIAARMTDPTPTPLPDFFEG
eukprot:CAMPEP_0118894216 /NCGR_PEP_ID=MMETSP1166-20130328/3090_1 /TAXON_ID=1104430 /ORGANISM="Chrysoreinhardia sp, Strain CCMP3193" /LENGTH=345 /DNA_ID=CAMNT_0006833103 /DNA_START=309 /DNA_END=1342 /DNA_ORIENTATION=+